MKTIFLVCLLGLLAASLAEDMAQTELLDEDDAERERDVRGTGEDIDDASYEEVMGRQKRHLRDMLCGICHPKDYLPVELACHHFKWIAYQKKSRCGWLRRRHTCYKTRHHLKLVPYCCDQGRMFKVMGKYSVCVNKDKSICGGFLMTGPSYPVCRINIKKLHIHIKFCDTARYRRYGDNCIKK